MKTYRVRAITQTGVWTEVQVKAGNSAVAMHVARQTYPNFRISGVIGEVR